MRMGLGYSQRQPFSFSCKKCGTTIKGELILKEPFNVDFEFINATIDENTELKEADFVIECHEDFMLFSDSNNQFSSLKPTPFMLTASMMGHNFVEFGKNRSLFKLNQEELKNKLFRINNFYIEDNPSGLTKEGNNLICFDSDIEIYNSLIQLNEMYFIPILKKDTISYNCSFFKKKILELVDTNLSELTNLVDELEKVNYFKNQLAENLSLLEQFDELFFDIKPIITLNYMEGVNKDSLIFSITNFDKVKQFYVDLFECVGRELNLLIGLRNLETNGDYNILNIPEFKKIKTFKDCILSSNGNKVQYFKQSAYYDLIKDVFNHRLRNGVGHYKCRFNQIKKEIEYYPDIKDISKSKKETISYVDFILNLYGLFNLLISLMYLKSLVYTVYYVNKSVLPLCLNSVSLVISESPSSTMNPNLKCDNNPLPIISLSYYWNGLGYTCPEIIDHDFTYWNFMPIYNKFNLCDNESTHIGVDLDLKHILISINRTKRYKFDISKNLGWYSLLLQNNMFFTCIERIENCIPYFNVEPAFPNAAGFPDLGD